LNPGPMPYKNNAIGDTCGDYPIPTKIL
jgi:hypothetical protein